MFIIFIEMHTMNVDCFLYILEWCSGSVHNYLSTKRFEVCSGIWECQIVNQRDIIIYEDVLFLFLTLLMCLKFTKQLFHRQTIWICLFLTLWFHWNRGRQKLNSQWKRWIIPISLQCPRIIFTQSCIVSTYIVYFTTALDF